MHYNESLKKDIMYSVAIALEVSLIVWSMGLGFMPFGVNRAQAAALSSVSDTLVDSGPGVGTNHSIAYTNSTATLQTETIAITFDPTTNFFGGFGSIQFGDVTSTGMTIVQSCSGGSNRVTVATTTGAAPQLVFTVCAGNTVASGTKTIAINNSRITNSTTTGSYIVRIAGTQQNSADTRIAIVDHVTVTASVDTTFTFQVTGLASGTTLTNNATTSLTGTSTPNSLAFGTLVPNVTKVLGQQLAVTTNANNGFAVTVHENQNLLSTNGASIHLFANGNATSTPSLWQAPANTLDSLETYGHYGITSDDEDLSGGTFGTSSPKYAGAFQSTTTLTVFSHNGPADGTTQDKGMAKMAVRIEISPLQAAGNDYTNQLIYVATPTF